MTLAQLFKALSYGELSNLSLSGEGSGTIVAGKQPAILQHTQDGLLKLYSRFVLREKDVVLNTYDYIQMYHLLSRYAVSNYPDSGELVPYIQDTPAEPFVEDVIRVLACHSVYGETLPLNDTTNQKSLYTPQYNIIQIPSAANVGMLSVQYQAQHPTLSLDRLDQEVELPPSLHSALRSWVAYKTYCNMVTAEASNKAQEHLAMYMQSVQEAVDGDLVGSSQSDTNTRFEANGWV